MKRVTGIGGIFFTAEDPDALRDWSRRHLDIDVQDWGGAVFPWDTPEGSTIWCIAPAEEGGSAGTAPFRVNYRVADLHGLIAILRDEGCNVLDTVEQSEFGTFGWVIDPEGNTVELWEPPAQT